MSSLRFLDQIIREETEKILRAEATRTEALKLRERIINPPILVDENGCHTAPDGSCVSDGPCLHTKPAEQKNEELDVVVPPGREYGILDVGTKQDGGKTVDEIVEGEFELCTFAVQCPQKHINFRGRKWHRAGKNEFVDLVRCINPRCRLLNHFLVDIEGQKIRHHLNFEISREE
jgi:hypothetical protein